VFLINLVGAHISAFISRYTVLSQVANGDLQDMLEYQQQTPELEKCGHIVPLAGTNIKW
jgi:hypothetical protein